MVTFLYEITRPTSKSQQSAKYQFSERLGVK